MSRWLLLLLACAFAAHAQGYDDLMAKARADCSKAAPAYPAADRPSPRAAAALQHCDANVFYYGIGRPVDDARARHCAFVSGDDAVLMMLYANGRGVPRDFALARRAACDLQAAPAEMSGRLQHLESMEADVQARRSPQPIDVCDDITSGLMMGVCTHMAAQREGARREAEIRRASGGWSPAQRSAWASLRKKADAYVQARGAGEVDTSGTARAAMVIEAQEKIRDEMLALLLDAEAGKLGPDVADGAAQRDRELNEVYRKIRALPDQQFGTVDMAGIRSAQRAWLAYRDAWVAFGRVRHPGLPGDAWRARLTAERVRVLEDVLEERGP